MKRIIAILLAGVWLLVLAACGAQPEDAPDNSWEEIPVAAPDLPQKSAALETWQTLGGSYTRRGSDQYNNGVLQMKYLDNSCVMFEFRLMEGAEDRDWARDIVLPYVLLVDDSGFAQYEDPDNGITITAALSEDGKLVTVNHSGKLPISCDGIFELTDDGLEVSEYSAGSILEFLAPAATSLNSANQGYQLVYNEEVLGGWFYAMDAVLGDTVIAKFIVARDLSAVYRVDDDIDPVLIFGTAQPMLDCEVSLGSEEEDADVQTDLERFLVPVISEGGLALEPGAASKLLAELPWPLEYSIEAKSSDSKIVAVKDGVLTAIANGTATITGTLAVEDASRAFSLEITVGNEDSAAGGEREEEGTSSYSSPER